MSSIRKKESTSVTLEVKQWTSLKKKKVQSENEDRQPHLCLWVTKFEGSPSFCTCFFNMAASLTHTYTWAGDPPVSVKLLFLLYWSLITRVRMNACRVLGWRVAHCRHKLPASCWERINTKNVYRDSICLMQSAAQRPDHLFKCT